MIRTAIDPKLADWANDHESCVEAMAEAIRSNRRGIVMLPMDEAYRAHVLLQLLAETPPRPGDDEFVAGRIGDAMGGDS